MERFITNSESETAKVAKDLAKRYKDHGGVIALIGELGSGKTTFSSFFAKELGVKEKVISPTFVLIRSHPFGSRILHHVDLYRLDRVKPDEIGLTELIGNPNDIVLIEWADKLSELPKGALQIKFKTLSTTRRRIEVY